MNFLNIIKSGVIIWDGPMGTMLQEKGPGKVLSPELMNLEDPDLVRSTHTSYLMAGSVGVTTNTFGANRAKLGELGLEGSVFDINEKGASIAREACGQSAFVSGSVGPTGKFVQPMGELSFDEAVTIFEEQVEGLVRGGVDVIKIETMMDMREMKAAIIASKNVSSLPVIAMMTFQENMRTLMGSTPASFGVVAEGSGADVLGINCSVGPAKMVEMLSMLATVTSAPLIAQPNAGIPRLVGRKTVFPMEAGQFAEIVRDFLPLGVRIISGCCGTTPDHIREIRRSMQFRTEMGMETLKAPEKAIVSAEGLKVASRSRVVNIRSGSSLKIVGERINPTGKKGFAGELEKGLMDSVIREASDQEEKGADILDVNVGAIGVDEESLMERAIFSVNLNSTLPVMIDSSNPDVILRGLTAVDGLAVVNSVTGEDKKMENLLPLVRKFGAALICLLLDESGIPETPGGRLKIALKIIKTAESLGIDKERLIMDCLATTVSSSPSAAICALDTMELVKREVGVPVILGVSNVSFGMPERELINRTFLSMACMRGLDMAIINPHDVEMVNGIYSSNLLRGSDPGGKEFIRRFSSVGPESDSETGEEMPFPEIREAVRKGLKEDVAGAVTKALGEGSLPMEINDEGIVKGLEEVGNLFDSSRLFLPQVIAAAEAAKAGFEILKGEMGLEAEGKAGRILLATVEGDIHDIGKNIVGTLLENHGFEVIDMGKNVPAEKILQEAVDREVDVVGLSALMTTTMREMENVLQLLRDNKVDALSIIGGAAVTEEFSEEIGAGLYARDAMDAVRKLKEAVRKGRGEKRKS